MKITKKFLIVLLVVVIFSHSCVAPASNNIYEPGKTDISKLEKTNNSDYYYVNLPGDYITKTREEGDDILTNEFGVAAFRDSSGNTQPVAIIDEDGQPVSSLKVRLIHEDGYYQILVSDVEKQYAPRLVVINELFSSSTFCRFVLFLFNS